MVVFVVVSGGLEVFCLQMQATLVLSFHPKNFRTSGTSPCRAKELLSQAKHLILKKVAKIQEVNPCCLKQKTVKLTNLKPDFDRDIESIA